MAALLKFGKPEHLTLLRDEGLLYMNPLPFFWKCEGKDAVRGDHFDSVDEIRRGTKFAIGKSPDQMRAMTGKFDFRIHPPDSHKINLFCMFAFVPNKTPWPIDERNFEFGTHALVINEVDDFLERMKATLDTNQFPFTSNFVEYVDDDHSGEVGPFKKMRKFEFQSEWRVVCYDGPGDVRQIRMGSIADISELVPCEELKDNGGAS